MAVPGIAAQTQGAELQRVAVPATDTTKCTELCWVNNKQDAALQRSADWWGFREMDTHRHGIDGHS